MPAPTFQSITKSATSSNATVSQYLKAYDLWVRHTIVDPVGGVKTAATLMGMSGSVAGFLTYVEKGAELHTKALLRSMNI